MEKIKIAAGQIMCIAGIALMFGAKFASNEGTISPQVIIYHVGLVLMVMSIAVAGHELEKDAFVSAVLSVLATLISLVLIFFGGRMITYIIGAVFAVPALGCNVFAVMYEYGIRRKEDNE